MCCCVPQVRVLAATSQGEDQRARESNLTTACYDVQSRDSVQNFLEVADSWNITDGVSHSLSVSRDVHCNSAPFKHSAYDRTVLHQGLLRAVATEAINYILQRKTPVAAVVHEQYMPVHEKVALVGELRVVPRSPALKPLTTNTISTSFPVPVVTLNAACTPRIACLCVIQLVK